MTGDPGADRSLHRRGEPAACDKPGHQRDQAHAGAEGVVAEHALEELRQHEEQTVEREGDDDARHGAPGEARVAQERCVGQWRGDATLPGGERAAQRRRERQQAERGRRAQPRSGACTSVNTSTATLAAARPVPAESARAPRPGASRAAARRRRQARPRSPAR